MASRKDKRHREQMTLWGHEVPADPSPWLVRCPDCGERYLTREQYESQMDDADAIWHCPQCGEESIWDDDNYELWTERLG